MGLSMVSKHGLVIQFLIVTMCNCVVGHVLNGDIVDVDFIEVAHKKVIDVLRIHLLSGPEFLLVPLDNILKSFYSIVL